MNFLQDIKGKNKAPFAFFSALPNIEACTITTSLTIVDNMKTYMFYF